MEQPLISVVIPFYSNINWLIDALDSVYNQTYKNIEVLVINDGSMENLDKVVERYENIYILNKENGGPAYARNSGIEKATGKYIAFLDSDDIWLSDKLTKQISLMDANNYVWSQHSYEMFWEKGYKTKIINTSVYSGDIYEDCFISLKIQTSCVVVLKQILIDNKIRFPENKRYGQDGDFYKQIASKYKIGYVDDVLSKFRIRGSNAGFSARVQIDSKASVWKEFKEDKNLLNRLPKPVIFAYKISNIFSKWLNHINKNLIKKEKHIEILSKFMYILPYAIYKFHAKNHN